MRKRMLFGLALFLLSFADQVIYCQTSEVFPVGVFHNIEIIGRIDVKIIVSQENKLDLFYEGIEREKISIVNEDGLLKVKIVSVLSYKNINIQLKIYCDNINSITASSGATVFSEETLATDSLKLVAESGGEIQLDLFADTIKSNCLTGGIVTLSGKAKKHTARISSGSTLSAYNLACVDYILLVTTKGKAKINASGSIVGKVNSGGYVGYMGKANEKEVETSFGGKIEKVEVTD